MRPMLSPLLVILLLVPMLTRAEVKTERVTYLHNGIELEGVVSYDDSVSAVRPGVLVVHDWTGVGPYVTMRCQQLAKLGYVAFAPDIYGKGVRPQGAEACGAEAGKYRKDRPLMRARAQAGLSELRKHPMVDSLRLAAMGYCFGGGVALELARSGADVKGVISFHGSLDTPEPNDARNIKGRVLVLHGAIDPYVPVEAVAAFQKEMSDAKVDWQLISYGGAVHSFTHKEAGTDISKGAAYNEAADRRSWQAMKNFFEELFAR